MSQNEKRQPPAPTGEKSVGEPEQLTLLKIGEWWEELWNGMPEFIQEDLEPFKTIYVHFENRKDMEAFAGLVGQAITMDTRSIWYPEAEIGRFANKRYIEASPPPKPNGNAACEDEEGGFLVR